ncbi:MAG: FAD-binding oxidoreductase [Cytophagales bacterium]|nr:FAD-binding oxidoreductase [Cytophagales bacterium]MDW8383592.1 FAD-dependent oxidoreductase [Flammeovirgaceae bacterium]
MVDYLIVGLGIAGTNLALTLSEKGHSLALVDDGEFPSSSRIAAGLFNPITGVKLLKSWNASLFFPYLLQHYRKWEQKWNQKFLYPIGIYVPFENIETQNKWLGAQHDERYKHFVSSTHNVPLNLPDFENPFGGMFLQPAGFLDINTFLTCAYSYLAQRHMFIREKLDYTSIKIYSDKIVWNCIEARKLIFSEGQRNYLNPFFPNLKYHRVKGEILTIYSPNAESIPYVINKGIWVVPLGNHLYKIGSTYDNLQRDTIPTEKGKQEILQRFTKMFHWQYTVVEHHAAIRPATFDRRPFVGLHTQYKNIGIFNGMGTKGVSMSPYLAEHFYNVLENQVPLMSEINFNRCYT